NGRNDDQVPARDDVVDQAVGLGGVGPQDEVPVGVVADLLDGLAGVVGQDLLDTPALVQDLLSPDGQVGRLTLHSTVRLVDQDAGVGEREAFPGGAGGQDDGGRR